MPGSLLLELRHQRGLSQEELAELTGLSARSIGDLERGATRRPRRSSLDAIADALGLSSERRAEFFAAYRLGTTAPPVGPVPAELPAGAHGFVGRDAELDRLTAFLRGGVRVVAIEGGAGMGKTELAVRFAHRVRTDFPDGQLFARLHGFGTTGPTAPELVLAQFLRSLGVRGDELPDGTDARAALLRTRLADRRMLLVLDDATDSAQVLPLLPGTASCASIVTSRRRLDGLRARAGAARLEVGELSEADSGAVLDALAGAVPPDRRRRALAVCGGMPLALRLIASRLGDLALEQAGLDALVPGDDPSSDVRELLSWSVESVSADARAAFAGLGLLPLPESNVRVVAAACGWTVERTDAAVRELVAVHLVQRAAADRIRVHDLVHDHAGEAAARQRQDRRRAAEERVEELFVAAGTDEQTWQCEETAQLLAVAERALARGAHGTVGRLSDAWWRHFYTDMRDDDAVRLHGLALDAADAAGDRAARARALQYLGITHTRAGRVAEARTALDEAVRLAGELRRPADEAEATGLLASMHAGIGEYHEAIRWARRTIELNRRTGRGADASLLNNLGMLLRKVGEFEAAEATLDDALARARVTGDLDTESAALNNLGTLHRDRGDLSRARASLADALDAARRAHNLEGECVVLTKLAGVLSELGEPASACDHLAIAQRLGATATPHVRNLIDNATGDLAVGDRDAARTAYTAVLARTEDVADPAERARALAGLGELAATGGDLVSARRHLTDAAAEYRAIGSPQADVMAARLESLASVT